ncbi:tRNA (adenosine(37)-N6)-threonylcarbamoyltransferase complex ATPase subunit type 1 TsaE [Cryobacterium sp. PH31-O1]|uniref:tRNA (adenosine(37)-N6)-threonylcarbamoyltransferase complex ATPase subunit type 1 TsaE n=1 Tax=Cryobacterium sp. PH31-O1 TaxID=3046306 RepID=UPI0024BB4E42|nr:tRNA (adenosine(37)-N6)-threonylcarbamoyltransferase complex ATPase subunit type 1 TsaE [Cryobacterium sp. PH31-O1]MDJ0337716.1 tRNA (adenosine(37)-N6)-threonylcarbamoyltransferase complex ATPase subunit type 1 TsaE [Cryobacterium sp. PH31-O1]
MAEVRRTIADAAAMHRFGVNLARLLQAGDLIVLTGPLGAGKTTLTRGLGEGLQVRGAVTSPTFVLARTHPSLVGGPPFVHVDAYRLGSAMELDDLDIDFDRSIVVVEWGRGLLDGVTECWLDIEIERPQGRSLAAGEADAAKFVLDLDHDFDEPRTLTISGHGQRWSGLTELLPTEPA